MINDYVVQWSTANHDNVASQLMRHETNSFAIQSQPSHITFNPMSPGKEERREFPTRRSLFQGTTIKRLGIPMECGPETWFD
jgi:hypothetical protein